MALSTTSFLRRSLAIAGIASVMALGIASGAEAAPAKLLKISNVLSQSKSVSVSTSTVKPKVAQVVQASASGISINTSNRGVKNVFDWIRCQYGQTGYCPSPN